MLNPTSQWVRRRYYAEDGYLKPIPGSKVEEYDPFAADPAPYLELARLDTSDEQAVERFVTRFGLLGLLQDRPARAEHHMTAVGMPPEPGGLLDSGDPDYLPGLRDHSPKQIVDIINSDAVWEHMAEPIEEFRAAADEFRAVYLTAAGPMSAAEAEDLRQRLEDRLRHVRPTAGYTLAGDGAAVTGWTLSWSFPSLLSACYQQLLLDLTGGRHLRICKNERCRRPFQAKTSKHFYCCDACGNAQEQRERRRGRKADAATAASRDR